MNLLIMILKNVISIGSLDFVGKVGKSMLVKHILSTRNDTLVISSTGKMSDLVCSIKEDITSSTRIKI